MGLRKRLNDNPPLAAGVTAGCVVLALLVYFVSRPGGPGGTPAGPEDPKDFFSIDDGKSWFADDAYKLPPFDKDGKPAYRARVYRCPHNKEFVGHLERYADADAQRMRALAAEGKRDSSEFFKLEMSFEVKKPGAKDWVKPSPQNAVRVNAIRLPKCPEGSTMDVARIMPPP